MGFAAVLCHCPGSLCSAGAVSIVICNAPRSIAQLVALTLFVTVQDLTISGCSVVGGWSIGAWPACDFTTALDTCTQSSGAISLLDDRRQHPDHFIRALNTCALVGMPNVRAGRRSTSAIVAAGLRQHGDLPTIPSPASSTSEPTVCFAMFFIF